ncbi:response regulator transcription factor [Noviherbaspirillum galbum]|uniref:Response regulator transcription factor n=1 Tax=Noviherbaspirillum galbum TaxID=2709383 RepID=A0A6B3SH93_9BURK|nr:response regulator transcription factor [Noviherbaspirillum galbum]NEX60013.1 response regulator transcription factor [Noviherbaspirillum galbum]
MENSSRHEPWRPRPFSVAVLESDDTLADALCDLLRESGFTAACFADVASLAEARMASPFDAYVLDFLADWSPGSSALERLVDAIRAGEEKDAPIFVLGNQPHPERVDRLSGILMDHRIRYQLKPVKTSYLARQVTEAVAKWAGL